MAGQLPAVGEVSYNGYTLPSAFSANVNATPIYDSAGRTVKSIHYLFNISWIATGGDQPTADYSQTSDGVVDRLRQRLMEPGAAFKFSSQGFGTVSVNTGGPVQDVEFGPTPRSFSWQPVGSNRACRVSWTLEVHIPECQSTPAYTGQPMEFTYETTFNIDHAGMTTRSITGTLEIPMTRSGRALPDMVDLYRQRILPEVTIPLGFRRQESFHISRDKRVLSFTVTDTEINSNSAFPEGITDVDMHQTVTTESPAVSIPFTNVRLRIPIPKVLSQLQFSGSFRVLAGYPMAQAYEVFQGIVDERARQAPLGQAVRDIKLLPGFSMPLQWQWDESIFDRSVRFSVTYVQFNDLISLLKSSGMWQPVSSTDWGRWRTSMHEAFNGRGVAKLFATPGDDVIVDLCQDGTPLMASGGENRVANFRDGRPSLTTPPAEYSWLDYANRFSFRQLKNRIRHRLLQSPPKERSEGTEGNVSTSVGGAQITESSHSAVDIIQDRGSSAIDVEMKGHGIRVGYGIPLPGLVSVGGVQAELKQKWFETAVIGYLTSGSPIYMAVWQMAYFLPDVPQSEIGPPNSFIDGGGDTSEARMVTW